MRWKWATCFYALHMLSIIMLNCTRINHQTYTRYLFVIKNGLPLQWKHKCVSILQCNKIETFAQSVINASDKSGWLLCLVHASRALSALRYRFYFQFSDVTRRFRSITPKRVEIAFSNLVRRIPTEDPSVKKVLICDLPLGSSGRQIHEEFFFFFFFFFFFLQRFLVPPKAYEPWVWEHEIWYARGSAGKVVSCNFWDGWVTWFGGSGPNMVKICEILCHLRLLNGWV